MTLTWGGLSVAKALLGTCAKCGGEDIYRAYHKQGCREPDCGCAECSYGSHAKAHGEHLHYHCRGCQFDWLGPVKGRKKVSGVRGY